MADAARARRMSGRIKQIVATVIETPDQGPAAGHGHHHRRPDDRRPARRDDLLHRARRPSSSARSPPAALESAKGVLRSEVGRQTGVRFTPSLTFTLDALPDNASTARGPARPRRGRGRQGRGRPAGQGPGRRSRPVQETAGRRGRRALMRPAAGRPGTVAADDRHPARGPTGAGRPGDAGVRHRNRRSRPRPAAPSRPRARRPDDRCSSVAAGRAFAEVDEPAAEPRRPARRPVRRAGVPAASEWSGAAGTRPTTERRRRRLDWLLAGTAVAAGPGRDRRRDRGDPPRPAPTPRHDGSGAGIARPPG